MENKRITWQEIVLFALPVVVFFAYNVLTPYYFDDFLFMGVFGKSWFEPRTRFIASFSDIILSVKNYFLYGDNPGGPGRVFANLCTYVFDAARNKLFFNIVNTIIYLLETLLICRLAVSSFKNITGKLFVVVNLALWLFIPAWGSDFLYVCAATNYAWVLFYGLIFLFPYLWTLETPEYTPGRAVSIAALPLGFITGMGVQNMSAGLVVFFILYFIWKFRVGGRLRFWEILGCAGFLAGLVVLAAKGGVRDSFINLLRSVPNLIETYAYYAGFLTLLFVFVTIYLYKTTGKFDLPALGLMAIGLGGWGSMLLAGSGMSHRSLFSPAAFMILANVRYLRCFPVHLKRHSGIALWLLCLALLPSFFHATAEIMRGYILTSARDGYIAAMKKEGARNLEVKVIPYVTERHSGLYDAFDIFINPDIYLKYGPKNPPRPQNPAKALYYGLDSIHGKPPSMKVEYPEGCSMLSDKVTLYNHWEFWAYRWWKIF
jgi:hypothetical protein